MAHIVEKSCVASFLLLLLLWFLYKLFWIEACFVVENHVQTGQTYLCIIMRSKQWDILNWGGHLFYSILFPRVLCVDVESSILEPLTKSTRSECSDWLEVSPNPVSNPET
jgi:hypothetical protein